MKRKVATRPDALPRRVKSEIRVELVLWQQTKEERQWQNKNPYPFKKAYEHRALDQSTEGKKNRHRGKSFDY